MEPVLQTDLQDEIYRIEDTCRSCDSTKLHELIDFGETPLADRLETPERMGASDPRVPLTLWFCTDCGLVQIRETVDREELFRDEYPYLTSVSPALKEHFQKSARALLAERDLDGSSLVVEAGSNDGCMLETFAGEGIPVLGVDPAGAPVEEAREKGLPTRRAYFGEDEARRLREKGRAADLFLANNVLAHVTDLNGFVRGIGTILKSDGLAVIEVPYVADLVAHCEFDTIYHQHLCYFSVTALDRLFRRHDLHLNRVDRLPVHGGSLRLYVGKHRNRHASVTQLLEKEDREGLDELDYYVRFAERTRSIRDRLREIVYDRLDDSTQLVGYGAAAKATTLLSYCGFDGREIDYVADLNAYKQGRLMPGNHLKIREPERLMADRPDYVLLLAWNFAGEILKQQSAYRAQGGRFIVPIPEPVVVEPGDDIDQFVSLT